MPRSYHPRDRLTTATTTSITGTSTSTPTTVASAAPEFKPKRLMAAATVAVLPTIALLLTLGRRVVESVQFSGGK